MANKDELVALVLQFCLLHFTDTACTAASEDSYMLYLASLTAGMLS